MTDPEPSRTAFSVSPELAAWTSHLREHGLTRDDHQRMHDVVSKDHDSASGAAWQNHQTMHDAEQRAVDKVETATTARFAAVNEFREQLREQARSFIVRGEYDAMVGRLTAVEQWRAAESGKDKGSAPYTSLLFSIAGALLSALVVGGVALVLK